MARPPQPLAVRIQGKYRVDADGHWIWTATVGRNGYGKIMASAPGANSDGRRRIISAHVASYLVHVGPIPDGKEIDHVCREKLCINPAHLEAVTHLENMRRSQGPGGAHWLRLRVTELERQIAVLETRLARFEEGAA